MDDRARRGAGRLRRSAVRLENAGNLWWRFRVRPFRKIAGDLRWIGRIDGNAYVWSVGAQSFRLRTVGVEADERGSFVWLEPYEEPLGSGLWVRVEVEHEELCRVSVLRLSTVYVDSDFVLRQQGNDPATVNVVAERPLTSDFSILFSEDGTATAYEVRRSGTEQPSITVN